MNSLLYRNCVKFQCFLEKVFIFLKVMAEVVEEAEVALRKAVEASKAEVVEAIKAEEAEVLVEEAVEVFKAAVDLAEAVVAAAAMEVAEVISLKLKPKYGISQNHFVVNLTLPRYFNLCFCTAT